MNMENLEEGSQKEDGILAKMEWADAEATPIVYANHLFVRHEGDIFVITLGQAHGPYWLEIPEELKGKEFKVPIHTVARIAVPPQAMKLMLDVLKQNYERFLEKQTKIGEK